VHVDSQKRTADSEIRRKYEITYSGGNWKGCGTKMLHKTNSSRKVGSKKEALAIGGFQMWSVDQGTKSLGRLCETTVSLAIYN